MNVWMKVCRKKATCRYCDKPILKGDYMVICRYYKRTMREAGGTPQKWGCTIRFHTQCWIDQAKAALESKPVVETRGGKKMAITDSDRSARFRILARRASITQRIRVEAIKLNGEQNIDKIIHLGGLLNKLKEEIELFGGVPKSW